MTSLPPIEILTSGRDDAVRLVMVHGALDRASGMARLARRLADDAHVIRYDRRGYGRSVDRPGPYTLAMHVEDLLRVIGDEPAVLFGHSYGSHVVLRAAAEQPSRVLGVAVYEPPMSWESWWAVRRAPAPSDPADAAEAFMRRMVGDDVWSRLPQSTRDARRAEGGAFVEEGRDLRAGAPWDPARIRCEVRVGYGSRTGGRFIRAAHEIADQVGGSTVVIEGADHGGHISAARLVSEELVLPLGAFGATPVR